MSPPAPQINTFMKVNNKPVIDSISKIFFIAELFLGVNRLPLLGVTKKIYYLPIHRDEELNRFKKIIKNKSNLDMAQIMKLYQRILQIHNCLYQAIKWQTLDNLWLKVSITLIELIPLSTPCILADQVSREVHQLKDLLASKLYENSLDKSSRSTARALLTLMKTHDMSFTLFHMFDINLALPIKFCALLLTYVIIMMQFNKVLNQSN
ncbi:uncharacterized protein LOC135193755 [Vanessa tameamea]|uniref:Uncharacterized protein LOC135193755 n=1 Tax=Vanessa tameamea TaxID=334116 RepID=A0ABM4AQS0_VANTA